MRHGDVCYLVKPNSQEDMVNAVIYITENPQEAERIGAKAAQSHREAIQ